MESTRPIRALMRGLDALTVLNSRDGATVSEVAQEIRLPRTTVYRIMETLCDGGFAFRDTADDRYRVSILVRDLSEGFTEETWVSQIAKPCISEVCRDIVWPVSLATLAGDAMMVRETTDHQTPLAIERQSAGYRVPLLDSAAGRVHLAFCSDAERDGLLGRLARTQRTDLERVLADVRIQGYATVTRTQRLVDEVSAAVPVSLHDRLLGVLTVRFVSSAVPLRSGLERFLPKMRQCAARISALFSELPLKDQTRAQATGAPDAAD